MASSFLRKDIINCVFYSIYQDCVGFFDSLLYCITKQWGFSREMSNYFISSILKGSVKVIYFAALLSFVFLFSISLKCNFFVFVDVLLCFFYVFHSYSGMLMGSGWNLVWNTRSRMEK